MDDRYVQFPYLGRLKFRNLHDVLNTNFVQKQVTASHLILYMYNTDALWLLP